MNSVTDMRYVLVTAARNESQYIESTIQSIAGQTRLPERWVIVSDGSTDGTDETVFRYSREHEFITLLRLEKDQQRSFSAKSKALNYGISYLSKMPYEFIGCLDADITLKPDYYEKILQLFVQDPLLGVAGGFIFELRDGLFVQRAFDSRRSVAGAIQVFRESCFKDIGGYLPLRYGGEDTIAEARARMLGFHVTSVSHLRAFHHRHTGSVERPLRSSFRNGLQDRYVGYHLVYELFVCANRLRCAPIIISAFVRIAGFLWGAMHRTGCIVPADVISFIRREQTARLKGLFHKLLNLGLPRIRGHRGKQYL